MKPKFVTTCEIITDRDQAIKFTNTTEGVTLQSIDGTNEVLIYLSNDELDQMIAMLRTMKGCLV